MSWQRPATMAAIFCLLAARSADACPACTTRGSGGYLVPLLLGAMILTPYIVATVVLRIVRKAEIEREREDGTNASAQAARDAGEPLGSGAAAKA